MHPAGTKEKHQKAKENAWLARYLSKPAALQIAQTSQETQSITVHNPVNDIQAIEKSKAEI